MLLQLAPQRSLRAAAALHLRPRHRQLCRTRVSQQLYAAHAYNPVTCGSSSIAAASRQRSALQHAGCMQSSRARSVQCFSTSTSSGGGSSSPGQQQQQQQHQRQLRIAVVGAGVAGLTSALRVLQELPGSQVTIFAEKFGTDTTTAGAAGIWGPYKLSDTPEHLVDRWAGDTFRHLTRLFYSPDGVRAGLSLTMTHYIHTQAEADTPPPSWHDVVFNFQRMDPKHVALLPGQYVDGYSFNNITCEGRYYLQFLTDEIQKLGGRLVQTRLQNLAQVLELGLNGGDSNSNFDAVVDCCGLGASTLLGDKEVYPIRGQIMRARAPWVTQSYFAGDYYVIPNRHSVVLGGTGQVGNWDTHTSLDDKARIWKGCCELVPSLVHAEVIEDWVGLRPGRTRLRLELDTLHITPQSTTTSSTSSSPAVAASATAAAAAARRSAPAPSPALAGGSILVSTASRTPKGVSASAETGLSKGPSVGRETGEAPAAAPVPPAVPVPHAVPVPPAVPVVPVVHNYGHGGAGLTLGWGCAGDVVQLLKQALGRGA